MLIRKSKSFRIVNQEYDKVVQRVSPRIPVPIKSLAFMKNVSSSLNGIVIAWALEVKRSFR